MKSHAKSQILACAALLLCTGAASAGSAVYSFSYFKNEPVAGLQVPLKLVEGVNGFTYETFADQEAGSDLRVFDADGTTLLQYEIENWDTNGVSIVWVKVPQFSSSTVLTLSWGDASAAAAPEENIWTDMNIVWHLAHGAKDSSRFATTGESEETPIPQTEGIGIGAKAGDSSQYAVKSLMPSSQLGVISNKFTISFWAKVPDVTNNVYFAMHGEGVQQRVCPVYNYMGSRKIALYSHSGFTGSNLYNSKYTVALNEGGWVHVAFAYDGACIRGYVNGHEQLNKAVVFSLETWEGDARRVSVCGASSVGFEGLCMDEYRLEGVARSAEWIRAACETQYSLLSNPGVEVSFPEAPADGTLSNFVALVAVDSTSKGFHSHGTGLAEAMAEGKALITDVSTGDSLPYELESAITNGVENSSAVWVKIPEYSRSTKLGIMPTKNPVYVPVEDTTSSGIPRTEHDVMLFHMQNTKNQKDMVSGEELSPYNNSMYAMPTPVSGPTGPYGAVTCGTNTLAVNKSAVFPAKPVTNEFTLSFWIRKDDWAEPGEQLYLIHFNKPNPGTYQRSLIGGYNQPDNNYLYFFNCGSGGRAVHIPDAGWHNYTYVQKPGKQWIYLDGELLSNAAGDGYNVNLGLEANTNHLALGGTTSRNHTLNGAMDEFRLENTPRSGTWVKACYDNQMAAVDGVWRMASPHFAREVSATGGVSSVKFAARLVCKAASEVKLFYGSADNGETDEGWDGSIDLGQSTAEGGLSAEVSGLVPDTAVFARFAARNEYSDGWVFSECAAGRANPLAAGKRPTFMAIVEFAYNGSALHDFPVAISIPASNHLPGAPSRFRVLDELGGSLPYEVETWNPSGESLIWVRLPTLDASTRVVLGWDVGAAADEAWPASDTWSADFLKVNHFSSKYIDSASGATTNSSAIGQVESGLVGESIEFDGSAGMLRYANSPLYGFGNGFTLSFWAKVEDSCGPAYVVGNQRSRQISVLYSWENSTTNKFRLFANQSNNSDRFIYDSPIEREDDEWHHYAWTYDTCDLVCYKDGEVVSRTAYPFTLMLGWNEYEFNTFFACTSSGERQMVGSLDEYRFERRGRSAEWIKACHDNQRSPSTFAKVGSTIRRGSVIILR